MRSGLAPLLAVLVTAALAPASAVAADPPTTVRVAIPSDAGSLTPYGSDNGYVLMSLVYDTLALHDGKGVARPWLARSWKREPNGRQVTVRLHRGVRWHDGRPLTADDVAFTFRYFAQHRQERFTPQVRDIRSVTVIDDDVVRFDLRRASLGFFDQPLADVPVLPRHLWENLPAGRREPAGLPIGSGPFRLVRHDRGKRYRFAAVARHFGARGKRPVARIEMPILRKPQQRIDALNEGDVEAIPVTFPAGAEPDVQAGRQFARTIDYSGVMLLFNVELPPFDARGPRRTVARLLDLAFVAGATGGPASITTADRGFAHPKSRWGSKRPLHRYDPRDAHISAVEQGVGAFRILVTESDPLAAEAGRRVLVAMERFSIPARLVRLSPRALDRALSAGGAKFDAAVVDIPALVSYDPAFLRALFGDPATSPLNFGRYRSARFERLADRVDAATTKAARRRAVAAELRLLANDVPAIPLFFGGSTFAYDLSRYAGWQDIRGSGILDKRSFLDAKSKRARAAPPVGDPTDTGFGGSDEAFSLVPVIIGLAALILVGSALFVTLRRRSSREGSR